MSDPGIPNSARAFIHDHIESVVQLEVLLLLHANPQRGWTAADIGRELRIDPAWASTQLVDLHARGMLQATDAASGAYQFTTDARLAQAVSELAKTYADRRVSVTALIFSKPVDKLKTFSDAFRLRKERPDG